MKKEIRTEIRKISPDFPISEKPSSGRIPDGYFGEMQDAVMKRLPAGQAGGGQVVRRYFPVWMRVAAVILIAAGLWLLAGDRVSQESGMSAFPDFSQEEALAYALEHTGEFDDLLAEELGSDLLPGELFPLDAAEALPQVEAEQLIDELPDEFIEEL